MSKIAKDCLACGCSFSASASEVKRGNARFCSRKCSSRYNGQARHIKSVEGFVDLVCAYCQVAFRRHPGDVSKAKQKHGLFFCCREHKDLGQRVSAGLTAIQPAHYGTGLSDYRRTALTQLPMVCARCGYEKHPEVLQVHHKDRDRSRNEIDNLEVLCPTCHAEEHFLAGDGLWWNSS